MRLGIKFIFLFFFSGSFICWQVKIGDNVEVLNPAAVLELDATDKGLLLPRLTNEQRDSIELNEASEGLLIFNVDTNEIQYLKRHSSPVKNGKMTISFTWESPSNSRILLEQISTPKAGQLYYNDAIASLQLWNGTRWLEIGGATFFDHSHTVTPTPAQQLSLSGSLLSISEGNTVDLLAFIQNNPLLVGPTGPTGPQGPQGPAGPAGDAASGTDSQTLTISSLTSSHTVTFIISQGNTVTLDLSSLNNTSAFITKGNVTSNASGSLTTDDFVFGSHQIDNETGSQDDARVLFDKSAGAFRAGYASGNSWNESNLGDYSFAVGYRTQASGHRTTALGNSAEAHSYAETALGSYNTHLSPNSKASWNSEDRLLVIGNGSSSSNKSDALVILKNGNIGIGDSTPTEASLVVSGSIVASGDITANAVLTPDYVFEHYFIGESFFQPHYQFMSLVEVKEFIQKHHHLPNVFSRKEIEKQGGIKLNVALEQQLEKIEELFLYAIEQEKRINYLEAKLQEIEHCKVEQKKR